MSIRLSNYEEILKEEFLLEEYGFECRIPEIGLINPQREMYAAMERAGVVKMFGAFQDGRLIGFASMLMTILPHYGEKAATVESLFVSKRARKLGEGLSLIRTMNKSAKEAGCKVIFYSAPTGSQLEKLLSKLKGYRKTNSIYCLQLLPK